MTSIQPAKNYVLFTIQSVATQFNLEFVTLRQLPELRLPPTLKGGMISKLTL